MKRTAFAKELNLGELMDALHWSVIQVRSRPLSMYLKPGPLAHLSYCAVSYLGAYREVTPRPFVERPATGKCAGDTREASAGEKTGGVERIEE